MVSFYYSVCVHKTLTTEMPNRLYFFLYTDCLRGKTLVLMRDCINWVLVYCFTTGIILKKKNKKKMKGV